MYRKAKFYFLFAGLALVIAAGIFLVSATPASAQCGSQASSCKNCHEVQGQDPVNADGTGWHQSHAFGDFCYICHGGNQQATDEAGAHQGMVAPLSDITAACQQCHVADLQDRAQVYADVLGVEIGTGSTSTESPSGGGEELASSAGMSGSAGAATTSAEENVSVEPEVDLNDPNLVNYGQQYNQEVLGQYPTNWGNIILIVIIIMLVVGGGYLVLTREKLISVTFGDTARVEGEYPADVVELLPSISRLKTKSRKSLKNILANPRKVDDVLVMLDTIISVKPEGEQEQ